MAEHIALFQTRHGAAVYGALVRVEVVAVHAREDMVDVDVLLITHEEAANRAFELVRDHDAKAMG